MWQKWLWFAAITCLAIPLFSQQATASASQADTHKEALMEEALLQLLHEDIYKSLQTIFRVTIPQFNHERIARIDSYVTGLKPHRPVDAIGGARVYEIDVEVTMSNGQRVLLTLNNESGSYGMVKHRLLR
ncbi:hypothetical protein COLU111180_14365 [Cohnella lubricantis]|uniref:DUF3888 domain-containing protein n=1 Tax=Cohnella lubricantis TaxID=2163172 RepID=A0A841T964_9BACL|nr:hypothetical protein [Cohnella lubricantis]MBB6676609.1 hypothetical protein [Cohnella lubricantis]MBP2117380.1 hypothetical protein [Cohnella lubricantis]